MENVSQKYLRLFLGALTIWGFMLSGCKDNQNPSDVSLGSGANKHIISPFNPGYFKDESQRHLTIHFNIDNGKLDINKTKDGELRPGKMPYHPGGDTDVVYKDSNGKVINRYSIEDPTRLRSCELIDGKREGVFPREKGEAELLLPANPEIALISVIYADKEPQEDIDVSEIVKHTFLVDTISPTIVSASTSSNPAEVIIVFSEPVELSSATNVSNYSINNRITVLGASLGSDLKTVTLTTSPHTGNISYTLTVNNIKDRASSPNMIAGNTQVIYSFLPDNQVLSIPTSLTAKAVSSSQINLSWNVSTDNVGVAGYRIYRNGVIITTVEKTTYQDTGLRHSTTYMYTVAAYDAAGNESGRSSASRATTLSFRF